MRAFRFANEASRAGKNAQLQDACLVVDALGEDAKYCLRTVPHTPFKLTGACSIELRFCRGTLSCSCATTGASSARAPRRASSTTLRAGSRGSAACSRRTRTTTRSYSLRPGTLGQCLLAGSARSQRASPRLLIHTAGAEQCGPILEMT